MPRRARVDKSRAKSKLTLPVHLALVIGPPPVMPDEPPDVPGILEEADLEALYFEHRDRLLDECTPCRRPWGYWRYEGVPDELRPGLARLVPVQPHEAGGDVEDGGRDDRRELARLVWLATEDRLDPGERQALPSIKRELLHRLEAVT